MQKNEKINRFNGRSCTNFAITTVLLYENHYRKNIMKAHR